MEDAQYWVHHLSLQQHPEGGYYSNLYRSQETIPQEALPERFQGERPLFSTIYYLLRSGEFSAFHRLQADEVWHHYRGSSITLYTIAPDGTLNQQKLGANPENGETLQLLVPNNHWMAVEVNSPNSFCLVGCSLAPAFVFEDFELAGRDELIGQFPQHQHLIERLTRQ